MIINPTKWSGRLFITDNFLLLLLFLFYPDLQIDRLLFKIQVEIPHLTCWPHTSGNSLTACPTTSRICQSFEYPFRWQETTLHYPSHHAFVHNIISSLHLDAWTPLLLCKNSESSQSSFCRLMYPRHQAPSTVLSITYIIDSLIRYCWVNLLPCWPLGVSWLGRSFHKFCKHSLNKLLVANGNRWEFIPVIHEWDSPDSTRTVDDGRQVLKMKDQVSPQWERSRWGPVRMSSI